MEIAFPIIAKSGKFKVQIMSPLFIGVILFITVLKFPDGCGPETLILDTPLISLNTLLFPFFSVKKVLPLVSKLM